MDNSGNKIIYFPVDEITQKEGAERINEKLLRAVDEERPALLFFFTGVSIKKETIGQISQKGKTITFCWAGDDSWAFEKSSKYLAPYFNWVSTADSKAPEKYKKIGYRNIIKTQCAWNHFLYKLQNLPKIYDVSFVGHPHGNRKKIIQKIKEAGINVQCWGSGWPNGRVSQEKMYQIFSQSKINLNFTKCSGVLWKEVGLLFLHNNKNDSLRINSPRQFLDSLKSFPKSIWANQIKGRNFEIPGCRGFCLSEYVQGLEDYYEIGKEIECFKDIPGLIGKIKYYLTNEEKREAIAAAGYERTIRDHTYEKRFQEIFKTMGLNS